MCPAQIRNIANLCEALKQYDAERSNHLAQAAE
jgi:hypothetical protein